MILNLPTAIRFRAGNRIAELDSLSAVAGDWIAVSPEPDAVVHDPAPPISRLLATLAAPIAGTVELFGQPLTTHSYVELIHLRTRLGFVVCRGGLLSNRSVSENIALPLAVHAKLAADDESARVNQLMSDFDLTAAARRRPDEIDGTTRFRACVARALALSPQWIVVEGTGDFAKPQSQTWNRLESYRAATPAAVAVCLPEPDPHFEEWLTARGGRVIRYRLLSGAA